MGTFKDSLKKWFYGNNGANAVAPTSNVCLLDAAGEPVGCDTIDRVAAFAMNNNDFVDMGLPSGRLWAKRNVGALKETDSGYYFSWGNLTGHSKGSGYSFLQAKYNATPAVSISANLTLAQDAARANLGGGWRMPTKEEFVELCNSAYTEYVDASGNVISGTNKLTTYNGVVGLLIRSKANGNTLFLPAAGTYNGADLSYDGSRGSFWSSSYETSTNAFRLNISSDGILPQNSMGRQFGIPIRPVI